MASDPRSPSAEAAEASTLLGRLASLGHLAESGLVVGAILALAVVLAPLAWLVGGSAGTLALAVAAGASLLAALFAVLVARLFHGPQGPMFGMLAYVVDAYRRGKSEDVFLIPVAIAYDQIQDVGSYVAEQRGGAKSHESFGWFLGVLRQLRLKPIQLAIGGRGFCRGRSRTRQDGGGGEQCE